MKISKLIAVAGAVSMLATALPFAVSADDSDKVAIDYRVVDNKAIITNVDTTGLEDITEIELPGSIVDGENTYEVVGVDDFAFALCEDLEVVCVPDSLTLANTGNVAFLTSESVMDFMDNELSGSASVDDVIRYVAEQANYKNGAYTDDDLADVALKLEKKLNMVDISVASTVEGKIMTLLKNVDKMNLNADLQDSFNVWISTITYSDFSLCGNEGTEMQTYAAGREFLGMKYTVHVTDYIEGDANGDGKFNVRDAAYVASSVAKGEEISTLENPAADYNEDGKVNVRDAAAMARALATATK